MYIEIYLLEQLDAFTRHGTLAAASEELHLTQPTLTRSMQKLESQLGVPLFERENKKIRLNENGRLAADYAARILSVENEMKQRLTLLEKSRRTLSFGSVSPGPVKELVPLFSDFFPKKIIQSEMKEADELIAGLNNDIYRIIVLNNPIEKRGLFCKKVFSERIYYCFVPTDHPIDTNGIYFCDINGRSVLMPIGCGFWEQIIAENMPDSKIILQDGNESVNLISKHSDLAAFSSDIAIKHNIIRPFRVMIPILDDAAKADYYCVCKEHDREMIKIIQMLASKKYTLQINADFQQKKK